MLRLTLILITLLTGMAAASAQPDPAQVNAYNGKLPKVTAPEFTEERRQMLATSAISCTDRPQDEPLNRNNYLWQYSKPAVLLDGYDKNRAFYGCADWQSAVGSVWMLLSLMKQDPKIGVASDIKDVSTTHFKKANLDGEYNFFNGLKGQSANYQKPYGYSWYLKLFGEVKTWPTADGKRMVESMQPLAKWMSERYVFCLYDLKFPYRTGSETNTAFAMSLALDYANLAEDNTLKTAIQANTLRLFSRDKDCPTGLEPASGDLISSCLTEAALMSRVMDSAAFTKWLDAFLPPVYSDGFQVYAGPVDISHASSSGPDAQVQMTVKAHQIGLNFERAASLLTITYALPKGDPRIVTFRTLAATSAREGYAHFNDAGYEGQHWLGTFALLYENENISPAPLGPPKPKTPDPKAAPANTPVE